MMKLNAQSAGKGYVTLHESQPVMLHHSGLHGLAMVLPSNLGSSVSIQISILGSDKLNNNIGNMIEML